MSASYEEFLESGLQRIQPGENNNPQDCPVCGCPLLMRISQLVGSGRDPRLHAAVRIKTCGHIHGLACLDEYLSTHHRCPTCNNELFPPWNKQDSSDEKMQEDGEEEEKEEEQVRFLDEVFSDDEDDEDWELSSEEEDDDEEYEEYEEDEDEDMEEYEEEEVDEDEEMDVDMDANQGSHVHVIRGEDDMDID
ncbi:hypothetical protein DM02DRAFT_680476 [Periconia macrospinosa]|uniref:RING-type domain-containing protein n=1 Tax=Periconia macrospinosa TaxID=97972 RepID=A0A2V1DLG6_9PLEO|nr:hypothetical protein DM02DRAFT_680476 [Periconia macrospinosa]